MTPIQTNNGKISFAEVCERYDYPNAFGFMAIGFLPFYIRFWRPIIGDVPLILFCAIAFAFSFLTWRRLFPGCPCMAARIFWGAIVASVLLSSDASEQLSAQRYHSQLFAMAAFSLGILFLPRSTQGYNRFAWYGCAVIALGFLIHALA